MNITLYMLPVAYAYYLTLPGRLILIIYAYLNPCLSDTAPLLYELYIVNNYSFNIIYVYHVSRVMYHVQNTYIYI